MLKYLNISNLAIIDRIDVEFRNGLNALTGETGAGKSILIGALDLLLGAKASADVIRTGEEEAHVEGLFESDKDFDFSPGLADAVPMGKEIVLSRKISSSGRSKCFINGNMVTLAMLQAVGESLVSIFGQHEHRVLLDPEEHIDILDKFGVAGDLRASTAEAFGTWKKTAKEFAAAEAKLVEIQQLALQNAADIEELTNASLKAGEEELIQEREVLKKASQIRERAYQAYQALYSRSGSLIQELGDVGKAVEYLASVNPKLSKLRENFEDAVYRLEDAALELRGVSETFHSDPARLEWIEDRLAVIRRLKKKYGKDLPGLITHLETLTNEAGNVLEGRSAVNNLRQLTDQTRARYMESASQLSGKRREAAEKLESAMKEELKELAMPQAKLVVNFQDLGAEKATPNGLEKAEFFLESNPGEAPRPLARIASGGELSRIMLALKALQVDVHGASTVIFDEVDAGIGGHTAVAVGTRLARVAAKQQVLCVTHLHQIAALADHHLSVRKFVQDGRTHIEVSALDPEKRVDELTRMLGASPTAESVKEHVRRLMDRQAVEVP